ncbi:hypothetical protein L1987_09006 [Smallanthus sonchifolius]|uniref:Uncharacterized protein n=1 Tax=Smallanthus sonchifolius TaxID=185202 RepID=A0ACB9JLR7_9ASTR|nr:hypothetical protein L1987_09006 [Smallanthus sonchifolius]
MARGSSSILSSQQILFLLYTFRLEKKSLLKLLQDGSMTIMYHNPIQCDMSSMIKTEANLYMRVVARCLPMRYEAKIIKKRLADMESKRVKVEAKPAADNK